MTRVSAASRCPRSPLAWGARSGAWTDTCTSPSRSTRSGSGIPSRRAAVAWLKNASGLSRAAYASSLLRKTSPTRFVCRTPQTLRSRSDAMRRFRLMPCAIPSRTRKAPDLWPPGSSVRRIQVRMPNRPFLRPELSTSRPSTSARAPRATHSSCPNRTVCWRRHYEKWATRASVQDVGTRDAGRGRVGAGGGRRGAECGRRTGMRAARGTGGEGAADGAPDVKC